MKRTAIIVLVVVVLVGGAAALYRAGASDEGATATRQANLPAGVATGTDAAAARITSTIYRISKLELDPAIFSDEAFISLRDQSEPIPSEPVGRVDPFAPLFQDALPGATSRTQGQGGLLNQNQGGGTVRATATTTQTR